MKFNDIADPTIRNREQAMADMMRRWEMDGRWPLSARASIRSRPALQGRRAFQSDPKIAIGHCRPLEDLAVAVDRTGLKPVIDAHYPLAAFSDALDHLDRGGFGKSLSSWREEIATSAQSIIHRKKEN